MKIFRESVKDSVERAKISLYGKEKDMFKFDMRVAQKTDRILQRLLIDGRVTKPPHPAEEVISKFTHIVYGAEKVRDCKNENMSDSIHWVDVCIRDLKNTIEMMRCFDSDLDYRGMEDIHETILNGYHMSKFYFLFFFDSYLVEGSDHNIIRERARFFIEDLNGVIERLRKQIDSQGDEGNGNGSGGRDMSWVTEIYVVEFTRLYDDGSLVYVGRTIKNNLEDAKESARWMKDETYANGEREYVSVNLWRISHDDKKQYFVKWWE